MPTQLLFGVYLIELISLDHYVTLYLDMISVLKNQGRSCFPDHLFTAIIAYVIEGLGTRLAFVSAAHHVIILHCTCRMPESVKMIQCYQIVPP